MVAEVINADARRFGGTARPPSSPIVDANLDDYSIRLSIWVDNRTGWSIAHSRKMPYWLSYVIPHRSQKISYLASIIITLRIAHQH